jgi:hypothetical protein
VGSAQLCGHPNFVLLELGCINKDIIIYIYLEVRREGGGGGVGDTYCFLCLSKKHDIRKFLLLCASPKSETIEQSLNLLLLNL